MSDGNASRLRCLRWDREGYERLCSLSDGEWTALWEALESGLGQQFLARRTRVTGVRIPARTAALLRRHAMAVAARNLGGRQILAAAIEECGRPVMLLKGADVVDRLYGGLGSRQMGDIDFLTHPSDAAVYDAWLRSHGYHGSLDVTSTILESSRHHHVTYQSPNGCMMPLELHWRLGDDGTDTNVDLAGIWARAIPAPDWPPGAFIMQAEDLFLYLCLHMKNHVFDVSLTQIWDVAEYVRAPAIDADWDVIWARAAEWRLTGAVRLALHLISTTLGVSTEHISNWAPDPVLSNQLPDLLGNLGRYPRAGLLSGHRLAQLLSRRSGWNERWAAVRNGALPSRAEVRAEFGQAGDGWWQDGRSYLRRWRRLLRRQGRIVLSSMAGDRETRASLERLAALRRFLNAR